MTNYKITFIIKTGIIKKKEITLVEKTEQNTLSDVLNYADNVVSDNSKFLRRTVEIDKIEISD